MTNQRFEIIWDRDALAELAALRDWWTTLPDAKADAILNKINGGADSLHRLGDIGRPSKNAGTRELSIRAAPYVLVYRVHGRVMEIIAVFHTAQER
jgi:toxin ParE1/3/4